MNLVSGYLFFASTRIYGVQNHLQGVNDRFRVLPLIFVVVSVLTELVFF